MAKIEIIGDTVVWDGEVVAAMLTTGVAPSTLDDARSFLDELGESDQVKNIDWDDVWKQIKKEPMGDLIRHDALEEVFERLK